MWYTDNDSESTKAYWKDSEVMRIFAEQYIDEQELPVQQESIKEEEPVTASLGTNELDAQGEQFGLDDFIVSESNQQANDEFMLLLESLGDLVVETHKYGNEKATYMIERAVQDIRALTGGE